MVASFPESFVSLKRRWCSQIDRAGWGLWMAVLCMMLTLAGCGRVVEPAVPVSYEELCGLPYGQMGVMNAEEVRRWMEETYGMAERIVNLDEFLPPDQRGTVVAYAWLKGEENGEAYLRDGRLFRVSRETRNGPTLGQVVAGLGPPEMIARGCATYGGHVVALLQLEYLALGVSLETWYEMTPQELSFPYAKWNVSLKKHMRVSSIDCYLPGLSLEEILHEVFFLRSEIIPREVNKRMPWPGFGAQIPLFVPTPTNIPVPTNPPR
jgi:hypothetical protein